MQTILSKIWTQVAVSISYDDIYYTTDAYLTYSQLKHLKQLVTCPKANELSILVHKEASIAGDTKKLK